MKCFEHNKHFNNKCEKKYCRYWIKCSSSNNCALILANKEKKLTLEDVGDIFNVTRMRICQIEKIAIKKLRDKVLSLIN